MIVAMERLLRIPESWKLHAISHRDSHRKSNGRTHPASLQSHFAIPPQRAGVATGSTRSRMAHTQHRFPRDSANLPAIQSEKPAPSNAPFAYRFLAHLWLRAKTR